jgi:hypothetical protein
MALITKTNVTELVQTYFELRKTSETVKEKCQKMHIGSKLPLSDVYNIFWAIRILTEPGYDFDDIEFHVKKNPIFAEIPTDDKHADDKHADDKHADDKHADDKHADNKPKQVGLLRQAIRDCAILSGKIKIGSLLGSKL